MPNVRNYENTVSWKRRKKSSLPVLFIVIACVVIVVVCAALFLRINIVEVQGNSTYSEQEILDTAKVDTGKVFIAVKTGEIAQRLKSLTYIKDAEVKYKFPQTLLIKVTEHDEAIAIEDGGEYWIADKDGTLLRKTDSITETQILLKGVKVKETCKIKQIMQFDGDQYSHAVNVALAVIAAIYDCEIENRVTEINIANVGYISFIIEDRLNVIIGSSTDVKKKIELVVTALNNSNQGIDYSEFVVNENLTDVIMKK